MRGKIIWFKNNVQNPDIIKGIEFAIPKAKCEGIRLKKDFQADSQIEICKNIWSHLKNNIDYVADSVSYQNIKLPNRLNKDGVGDCKSYSVFTSSVLSAFNIPHDLVYCSYDKTSKVPTHVYVQTKSGIIIDAVWHSFNKEKPFAYKYKKSVKLS